MSRPLWGRGNPANWFFRKPTHTHQSMQRKSCHTKKAFNYSLALRYRRIYWEDRQFHGRLGELVGRLKDRSYKESLINEQIDRLRRLDRGTLLATTDREPNPGRDDRIPVVITYYPGFNSNGKAIRDLHSMPSNSKEYRKIFPEPPVTAFRRRKNLNDLLVKARLTNNNNCDKRGCTRSEKSRCQVCQSMFDSDSVHSYVTKKEYKITFSFNYDSTKVVYFFNSSV